MADALLTLEGVHTHIGQYHILQGVDFEVPRGGMTVLLGRNGAGKTTTLRTIMGLWKPSARPGDVRRPRHRRPAPRPTSRGPASPTCRRPWACSPISRCARTWCSPPRAGRRTRRGSTGFSASFPALRRFWTHPAGVLSGGQKQMLSIARAIIEPRRLILIDEPTKGIAPAIIDNMIRAFAGAEARRPPPSCWWSRTSASPRRSAMSPW